MSATTDSQPDEPAANADDRQLVFGGYEKVDSPRPPRPPKTRTRKRGSTPGEPAPDPMPESGPPNDESSAGVPDDITFLRERLDVPSLIAVDRPANGAYAFWLRMEDGSRLHLGDAVELVQRRKVIQARLARRGHLAFLDAEGWEAVARRVRDASEPSYEVQPLELDFADALKDFVDPDACPERFDPTTPGAFAAALSQSPACFYDTEGALYVHAPSLQAFIGETRGEALTLRDVHGELAALGFRPRRLTIRPPVHGTPDGLDPEKTVKGRYLVSRPGRTADEVPTSPRPREQKTRAASAEARS